MVLHNMIENYVLEILSNSLKVNPEKLKAENFDELLTGNKINLTHVEMTYLFLEIEKKWNISFPEHALKDYGFGTINKIVKLIKKQLDIRIKGGAS